MIHKKEIENLPRSPGVYIFHNSSGEIIYVGKAINLRNRVRSYFTGVHHAKTEQLVKEAVSFSIKQTDSAIEALILEANLIKKYQPIYNIREKDDKSYLYVWISKEKFPRVSLVRATDVHKISESKPRLFGPYTSSNSIKTALEIIRPALPYRSCSKMPKKACLYGYLRLCDRPCEGKINAVQYKERIDELIAFLRARRKSIIRKMNKQMAEASGKQNYEEAALLRDKIKALTHINDVAVLKKDDIETIYNRIEGYDISNISGANATGSMVVFINGESEKSEYKKFKIKNLTGANDTAMLAQVLARRARHKEWGTPDLMIIDGGAGQLNAASHALGKCGWHIPLVAIAKGAKRKNNDFRFHGRVVERNLMLFKQVRDEAHRFAIGYYRKLHRKQFS